MTIRCHLDTAGSRLTYFSKEYGNRPAVTSYDDYRRRAYSYRSLRQKTFGAASLLLDKGFGKGDALMVSACNSAEYTVLVFAAAVLGIRIVPVDVTLGRETIRRYIDAVRPRLLMTSRCDLFPMDGDGAWPETLDIRTLFETSSAYPDTPEAMADAFPAADWYVDVNDVYIVVFTSGTTAEPKMVPLTHRNLVANLANLRTMSVVPEAYSVLSMAPLSHALGVTLGLYAILAYGAHLVLAENLSSATLTRILKTDRIDGIVTVPAFLVLMKEKIMEGIAKAGGERRFHRAMSVVRNRPLWVKRLIFRRVLEKLGGDLKWIVTGAAPLAVEVGAFFEGIGVMVTEGYGLTECLMVCGTDFAWRRLGTVGKCLPGQEIKLDRNNEVWVAGPNVFAGYPGMDRENTAIFRDGWMRTGDIGRIDDEGFLTIVGRRKNVIIGPSGLNIYPEDIEAVVETLPAVRECVVLNSPEEAGALYLVGWVRWTDGDADDLDGLRDTVNRQLGSHQRLAALCEWPEEDFPRTASGKVKRRDVAAKVREAGVHPRASSVATAQSASPCAVRALLGGLTRRSPAAISDKMHLVADLGLDSLGIVELIAGIEGQTGEELQRDAFFNRDLTVSEVIDMVATKTAKVAPGAVAYTPALPIRGLLTLSRTVSRTVLPAAFRRCFDMAPGERERLDAVARGMRREGHIIVANHASHLDTPSVFAALPAAVRGRVVAAAARDHFFNPAAKHRHLLLSSQMRIMPLDRTADPRRYFMQVAQRLDAGDSVLVFPEGTRSRTGVLGPFHPSIGRLIEKMRAPVLPVIIEGTHALWPVEGRRPKRGRISVRVLEPIRFSATDAPYEIRDRLAALFEAHLGAD